MSGHARERSQQIRHARERSEQIRRGRPRRVTTTADCWRVMHEQQGPE